MGEATLQHPEALNMLLAALVTAVCLLVVYILSQRFRNRSQYPKGYTKVQTAPPVTYPRSSTTTDSFMAKKCPTDADFVVIGSGIGGLYTAGLLARVGKKVVVLEQHYVAGGCTHTFEDHGYEFDTGLHYIGRKEKYEALINMVSDPDKKVEWARMGTEKDGWVYDEIKVGDAPVHKFRSGAKAFVDDLCEKFGESERTGLEEYLRLVNKTNKSGDLQFFGRIFHPLVAKALHWLKGKHWDQYACKPALQVISTLTSNKQLIATLCGQFGNYGMAPNKASFFIHAGIVAHYLDGGFYPIGGPGKIAEAIVPVIEQAGGRVFVKAMCQEVLMDEGRCTGVVLDSGERIMAKEGVISTAGAHNTFHKLIPRPVAEHYGLIEAIDGIGHSMTHICAFVGLEGSTEELGLRSANLWSLPTHSNNDEYDVCSMINAYHSRTDTPAADEEIMFFLGFPSCKDPSYKDRFPNKSACCILTEAQASWFGEWKDQKCMKRDDQYQAKKKAFEEVLLRGMYKNYPKTKGKVQFVDMSTPLTNMHYLASPDGCSYGFQGSAKRFNCDALKPRSPIPGLWMSGQDVTSFGIAGAIMGGVLCCHDILGYDAADLILYDRDLIHDMMNVPIERCPSS